MDKTNLMGDARFLRVMAVVLLIMTVAAFMPRYLVPLATGVYDPPASWNAWMHPHAIAGFGFSLLFLLQPTLIARQKFDLHRKMGWFAAAIVLVSLVSGVGVQVGAFPIAPDDGGNVVGSVFRLFQSLPMMAGFFVAAIVLRKKADWHWRFMYMAAYAAVGTIIARLFAFYTTMSGDLVGMLVGPANLAFILVLPISDKIRSGRVHPASWISLAVFVVFQAVLAPLALSDWWAAIATG